MNKLTYILIVATLLGSHSTVADEKLNIIAVDAERHKLI